jgi:hypothetical protein
MIIRNRASYDRVAISLMPTTPSDLTPAAATPAMGSGEKRAAVCIAWHRVTTIFLPLPTRLLVEAR